MVNDKTRLSIAEKALLLVEKLYDSSYKGSFFEAGANNGILQSNTFNIEKLGWSGILVEPSPEAFAELTLNRPKAKCFNVALVSDLNTVQVTGTFTRGSLLGTIHPEFQERDRTERFKLPGILKRLNQFETVRKLNSKIELETVKALTLDSVFEDSQISEIDLFFLDVEGYELEVLRGFNFSIMPRILIIETRTSDLQSISELLLAKGYICAANFSGFSKELDPIWAGDHQDFAWCQYSDSEAINILQQLQDS